MSDLARKDLLDSKHPLAPTLAGELNALKTLVAYLLMRDALQSGGMEKLEALHEFVIQRTCPSEERFNGTESPETVQFVRAAVAHAEKTYDNAITQAAAMLRAWPT